MDKASGAKAARLGLDARLNKLAKGDTLLVWRLDRLTRVLPYLFIIIEELLNKKVNCLHNVQSMTEFCRKADEAGIKSAREISQCSDPYCHFRTNPYRTPAGVK